MITVILCALRMALDLTVAFLRATLPAPRVRALVYADRAR